MKTHLGSIIIAGAIIVAALIWLVAGWHHDSTQSEIEASRSNDRAAARHYRR